MKNFLFTCSFFFTTLPYLLANQPNDREYILEVRVVGDNSIPGSCIGSNGSSDGIMILFKDEIDDSSIDGSDFIFIMPNGAKISASCALAYSGKNAKNSKRAFLLEGEFGSLNNTTPSSVQITGDVYALNPASKDAYNLKGINFSRIQGLKSTSSIGTADNTTASTPNTKGSIKDNSSKKEIVNSTASNKQVSYTMSGVVTIDDNGIVSLNPTIHATAIDEAPAKAAKIDNLGAFASPATKEIQVSFTLQSSQEVTVSLHRPDGKLLRLLDEGKHYAAGTHLIKSWDINIPKGEYLVKVHTGGGADNEQPIQWD